MQRALGIALLAALLVAGCSRQPPRRVDLLLISVDTLRADQLGCYGGPPKLAAAICSLATRGVRYEWALSTAPSTAPSVASMLTSLYPAQHRVNQNARNFMGDELLSVAEVLQQAGYQTAAFVSNPVLDRRKRLDQGFDVYDMHLTRRERNRRYAERDALETTEAALAWLRGPARSPWFLWVHYQDPHGPYDPPGLGPPLDQTGGQRLPLLENDSGRGGIPAYQALPGASDPDTYRRRYRAEVRHLDWHVGLLLVEVETRSEPPAVVFTADHGEALGEDGYYFAHGHSVGLDQIRVPLLVRPATRPGAIPNGSSPGAPAPGAATPAGAAVVSRPVSLVDLAPTLLGLAGLEAPDAFAGRPLPLSPDAPGDVERLLFSEASRQLAVIRGRDYFARDRRPGAPTREDGHSWGDGNPPLPPRGASLEPGGALPTYRPEPDAPLEAELQTFVDAHPWRRGHQHAEVPRGVAEQLRALGYTADD